MIAQHSVNFKTCKTFHKKIGSVGKTFKAIASVVCLLNVSFPMGGLTCSLQDHQLSEYLQIKKK